jgi:hypothetical protein
LDDRWFESRQVLGIFLFTTASRPALGFTQSPIQWVRGALFLGREADHSPASSVEVRMRGATPPLRLHGVMLSSSTGTTIPDSAVPVTKINVNKSKQQYDFKETVAQVHEVTKQNHFRMPNNAYDFGNKNTPGAYWSRPRCLFS